MENAYFEYYYEGIERNYPNISFGTIEKDEIVVSFGFSIEKITVDDKLAKW